MLHKLHSSVNNEINGDSASTISRKVLKYLNNPDDMFHHFLVKVGEDEDGNPIYGRKWKRKYIDPQTGKVTWKDFDPKDYHTGRGVYRSAYKNAMRLTRTETNTAYRSSEQDRWQNMDFVLGYRVKRSRNHPDVDICDDLSANNDDNESDRGVYPNTFVFKGWHPQCRCFVVPILASRADFIKMQKALLNGEEPPEPSGKVEEPNEYFNEWVSKNRDRIENASTLPYWVQDNKKDVEEAMKNDLIGTRSVSEPNFKNDSKIQEFALPTIKHEQMPTDKLLTEIHEVKTEHVSFRLDSGGSITVEDDRIANANKNKQERLKFVKEHRMCRTLAAGGFNVVLLNEIPRVSSSDILIDGVKADLKATKGANNIGKYGKKAINKQGANLVIFEFEEITDDVHKELNKLAKRGIHGKYYKKGETAIQAF